MLFDGDCVLCNRWAKFILEKDNSKSIHICSSIGYKGQELIKYHKITASPKNTVILILNNCYYIKSSAVLKTGIKMKGPFSLFILGYIVPRFIRDFIYDIIAKRRNKISANICEVSTSIKNHPRFIQ